MREKCCQSKAKQSSKQACPCVRTKGKGDQTHTCTPNVTLPENELRSVQRRWHQVRYCRKPNKFKHTYTCTWYTLERERETTNHVERGGGVSHGHAPASLCLLFVSQTEGSVYEIHPYRLNNALFMYTCFKYNLMLPKVTRHKNTRVCACECACVHPREAKQHLFRTPMGCGQCLSSPAPSRSGRPAGTKKVRRPSPRSALVLHLQVSPRWMRSWHPKHTILSPFCSMVSARRRDSANGTVLSITVSRQQPMRGWARDGQTSKQVGVKDQMTQVPGERTRSTEYFSMRSGAPDLVDGCPGVRGGRERYYSRSTRPCPTTPELVLGCSGERMEKTRGYLFSTLSPVFAQLLPVLMLLVLYTTPLPFVSPPALIPVSNMSSPSFLPPCSVVDGLGPPVFYQ